MSNLKYAPIYFLFAVSLGLFCDALLSLLRGRAALLSSNLLAVFFTLLYMVQFITRHTVQTYYPLSALRVAGENKLFQFIDVILLAILEHFPVLLLMSLPLLLLFISYGKRKPFFARYEERRFGKLIFSLANKIHQPLSYKESLVFLLVAVLFHFAALGIIYLPAWTSDISPKQFYESDTDYNYQVEALGVYTMIRLDLQHMIKPPKTGLSDFSVLEGLEERPKEDKTQREQRQAAAEDLPVITSFDTSPNMMAVDFTHIGENTEDSDIEWLCNYFASLTPSNKNEYTGMFKGYNVIFITVEALDGCAISEAHTPTLHKMRNEGFVFNNFYTALHYTSTANGEFQNLLGLYPKNGNPISMSRVGELDTNCYFSLAQQLGRLGYMNWGYHNNWDLYGRKDSHSTVGYYWQYEYHGLWGDLKADGDLEWPQKDTVMVEESMSDYMTGNSLFNVYYLTVSGHMPYGWNWATESYREELSGLDYSTQTAGYIGSVVECDRAVKMLVDGLEANGKLENTVFVIVPDHIPYSSIETKEEICGHEFGTSEAITAINESAIDFEVYKNSLILWSASMEKPVEIDKVCCQVDILPTLSNLMGLEFDSRMLSGSDILSDSPGLVVFSSRSWRSDKGFYNSFDQSFTPAPGTMMMTKEEEASYVETMNALVSCKLDCTAKIIESDFYDYVFGSDRKRIEGAIAPAN